jgi:precorrin-2/cobalt-factor-2 C20-methyltransferase
MVSLGPGDCELVTFKAIDRLKKSDAICIPTKSSDLSFEKSLTHKIITKLQDIHSFEATLVPIYSPMNYNTQDWYNQVETIYQTLKRYDSVSFVTLGDAGVYSSVYYLLDIIAQKYPKMYQNCEVVAGVTSFSQASALVKKPLCIGDSRFEIVPLHKKDVKTTTVYMRPKISMPTTNIIPKGDIYTFENINYQGEQITKGKIDTVSKYMTLFIDFFQKDKDGV